MVWRYRYRLNGKYEKLTLGKYPALTLKNARLMRDGASQMAAVGESPAQKKQRAKVAGPADTTLKQFAERYFKEIQQRHRKDTTMPRRYLDKDILPHIGMKSVCELTTEDVRSVIWRKKVQGSRSHCKGRISQPSPFMTCGAGHLPCCTKRVGHRMLWRRR